MWGGSRGEFVEDLAHLGGLVFGPLADGRATANGRILFLDLGSAARGDKGTEVRLQAPKRDEISVGLKGKG